MPPETFTPPRVSPPIKRMSIEGKAIHHKHRERGDLGKSKIGQAQKLCLFALYESDYKTYNSVNKIFLGVGKV